MPEHRCFYDRMMEVGVLLRDEDLADVPKNERFVLGMQVLVGAIGHAIDGLSIDEINEHGPELEADLHRFYTEIIVPLDLPWVPNLVEPAVDASIGTGLLYLFRGGVSRLKKNHDRIKELLEKANPNEPSPGGA